METSLLCRLFLTLSDSWTFWEALLGLLPISNRQFQWHQDTPPPTNLGNFVHVLENSVHKLQMPILHKAFPPAPLFYEVMQMIFCELREVYPLNCFLHHHYMPGVTILASWWLVLALHYSLGPGGEGGHPHLWFMIELWMCLSMHVLVYWYACATFQMLWATFTSTYLWLQASHQCKLRIYKLSYDQGISQ